METDTIAAISTPLGEGGIAIVRVSGTLAIPSVARLFKSKTDLRTVDSHTIHYGHFSDSTASNLIDEVMVTVMKSPRTYTREDVVEVNCHGGIVSVRRVLDSILASGVRLAEPGEFTKRAFLNGRLDLSQAEGVIDVIRAKTDQAMNVAFQQLSGHLSNHIQTLRQKLIEVLAHIEVTIDYREHDVDEVTHEFLMNHCQYVVEQVERLLASSKQGKILREGLRTAIIGRPNVGKSSLLNTFVQDSKAIVTNIPGTTRDLIEEYVNVRGIPLHLIDTAGIRDTTDVVEKMGVDKSRQVLKEADLVLLVFNAAEQLTAEDLALIELAADLPKIMILNKTDLNIRCDVDLLQQHSPDTKLVYTSLLRSEGVDELEMAIYDMFAEGRIEGHDLTYVSRTRHIQALQQARQSIIEAIQAIENGLPVDVVQIDIHKAWELLGEITGDTVSESLIDQLFTQFCLGK